MSLANRLLASAAFGAALLLGHVADAAPCANAAAPCQIAPSVSLTATSTSSEAAITAGGTVVEITNNGTVQVNALLGATSAVTATSTSPIVVPPGQTVPAATGGYGFIAVYAASASNGVVVVSQTGPGYAVGGGAAGGGGGSNVTTVAGSTTATTPTGATSSDIGGTVTTGGSYQTVLAASATRKGCLIQNPPTATEVLSIKVGTMTAPFVVPIGNSFSCAAGGGIVVTDGITLTAATTGHAFTGVSQ